MEIETTTVETEAGARQVRVERVPLDSNRFTDEDRVRLRSRLCIRQTAYGLPWDQFCGAKLPEPDRVECPVHEADQVEQYPGQPLLRLVRA